MYAYTNAKNTHTQKWSRATSLLCGLKTCLHRSCLFFCPSFPAALPFLSLCSRPIPRARPATASFVLRCFASRPNREARVGWPNKRPLIVFIGSRSIFRRIQTEIFGARKRVAHLCVWCWYGNSSTTQQHGCHIGGSYTCEAVYS